MSSTPSASSAAIELGEGIDVAANDVRHSLPSAGWSGSTAPHALGQRLLVDRKDGARGAELAGCDHV
jgi:hypothetical protein